MEKMPRKRRQPMTPPQGVSRRTHRKSRSGCLSCKKRRVKCGEEKPCCQNCQLKSSVCEYVPWTPLAKTIRSQPSPHASFALQDLRLFHHFLVCAHPSLPLGNQSVWTHEIPQLVHQSSHLTHALLALGASHLGSIVPTDKYSYSALKHRCHAIVGLKQTMAQSENFHDQCDAMLATCYALAYQSTLLPTSGTDFATFVRGCALITGRIHDENCTSVFKLGIDRPTQTGGFSNCLRIPLSQASLSHGWKALKQTASLLKRPFELGFYNALQEVFISLQHSPSTGYLKFLSFYSVWFNLAEETFQFSEERENPTAQLLWAFFIGLQLFILCLVSQVGGTTMKDAPHQELLTLIQWLEAFIANTPAEMTYIVQWPESIAKNAMASLNIPSDHSSSPERVASKVELLKQLDTRIHVVLGNILDHSASLTNWTNAVLGINPATKANAQSQSGVPISKPRSAQATPPHEHDAQNTSVSSGLVSTMETTSLESAETTREAMILVPALHHLV